MTGYVYGEYSTTNYQSIVPVSACAVGYSGTVTTPQVTCLSTGDWSIPQGCTIVGMQTSGNARLFDEQA